MNLRRRLAIDDHAAFRVRIGRAGGAVAYQATFTAMCVPAAGRTRQCFFECITLDPCAGRDAGDDVIAVIGGIRRTRPREALQGIATDGSAVHA